MPGSWPHTTQLCSATSDTAWFADTAVGLYYRRLCPAHCPVRDPSCLGHAHRRGSDPAHRCRAFWYPHAAGARQGSQAAPPAPARGTIEAISQRSAPWLFHSVRNGAKALTRRVALLGIKEATVAAGLANPDRVSPHVLRHTFASHMHSNSSGPTPA